MTNKTESLKDKYQFSDFTETHYFELLKLAKENHEFCFFDEISENNSSEVIWRHDLDLSVHRALTLAKIENSLGVKSTYFIHLHSEYYNVLENEIFNLIKEIHSLGHQIGLHFDTHFYDIQGEESLDEKILLEKNFIENIFNLEVKAFSFHNTTPFTMNCKNMMYGGLINAYADFFQLNFKYCSDSNGYWRFTRLLEFLEENKESRIQVLTHPVWWQKDIQSPWSKVCRTIEGRSVSNKKFYGNHLKKFNMLNVGK